MVEQGVPHRIAFEDFITLPMDCICVNKADDTTGAYTNRVSGALLGVWLSDSPAAATTPYMEWSMRIDFVDL